MRKVVCFLLSMMILCFAALASGEALMLPQNVSVGDIITFGHYEQDCNLDNGREPIEWIVLDVQDGKALLLSRYGLDSRGYHQNWDDVTWETCSLRLWLNDRFLNAAFSAEEQSAILTTPVDNSDSQGYDWTTPEEDKPTGGNNTQDQIFLLSIAEANRYLNVTVENGNNTKSRVAPTAYAIFVGAYSDSEYQTDDGDAAGYWWLRSPGSTQSTAAGVLFDGSLSYARAFHDSIVRPALWVNLRQDNQ